ncbi:MAG: oligosaccharide flippase family protein [Lachnospiraceae bacterium]|nr:oligosaccharide flippase family protein [Lachnospiraceae bacterium]
MKKHPILVGTLILSGASILSRIIGFLYRIYLSRTFGAEAMGVLQMTAPVTAMVTAISCTGIQTALSKRISELKRNDRQGQKNLLLCSLFWSAGLSLVLSAAVWHFSDFLSAGYLQEPRTEALLKIMAFSFPLTAAHGCFMGYYFGRRETRIPALSQLIEQLIRVSCVIALCSLASVRENEVSLSFAVLGSLTGELAAVVVCLASVFASSHRKPERDSNSPVSGTTAHATAKSARLSRRPVSHFPVTASSSSVFSCTGNLFSMAVPLSFNRLALNFLQSLEAVRIPLSLQLYGYSSAQEAYGKLRSLTVNTSFIVVAGGLFCGLGFFMFSDFLGGTVFGEPLAGSYIRSLCLLCPVLYLNQVLSGILQGLGRAFSVFFINTVSVFIRLGFIFFCIPQIGIQGYFYGMLASQLVTSCCFLVSMSGAGKREETGTD